ncbi:hypothetical protein [Mesorhizobium sp. NBSH29]|uniref:hypothetical protein n=1 Tax=Mesorhizobium sp. NBSH29 TaxID=2654249 RepID=UPI00189648BB|nr:hypothetical protein [Mesorhizobium sp. NBSH29]
MLRLTLTVAICAAAAAVLFFRTPTYFEQSYVSIVDPLPLRSHRPSGLLMDGQTLKQELKLSAQVRTSLESLKEVCVRTMFGTYGRQNAGMLHVVMDTPWWTVAKDLDVQKLRDNTLATFCGSTSPRSGNDSDPMVLTIKGLQGTPRGSVSAWMTADLGKGRVKLNGVDQDMGLVFAIAKPDERTPSRVMRQHVLLAIFLLTIGVLSWKALRPSTIDAP